MARQSFIRYVLKVPLRTLQIRLLISFAIGYVAGGFVQATVFSTAYAPGHFHDRITNGIAGSLMGTIFFGHACCELGNAVNYWPYIALNTVVFFCIWMVVGYLRDERRGDE
jgi:hypothetical protein